MSNCGMEFEEIVRAKGRKLYSVDGKQDSLTISILSIYWLMLGRPSFWSNSSLTRDYECPVGFTKVGVKYVACRNMSVHYAKLQYTHIFKKWKTWSSVISYITSFHLRWLKAILNSSTELLVLIHTSWVAAISFYFTYHGKRQNNSILIASVIKENLGRNHIILWFFEFRTVRHVLHICVSL